MTEPERFAVFALKEALGYLEARHRTSETMVLREQIRRAMSGLAKKYGELPKREKALQHPHRTLEIA